MRQKSILKKTNKGTRSLDFARDDVGRVFRVFRRDYKLVPLEVFKGPYEVLVSTLMSSRTNDDTTVCAANRLFERASRVDVLGKLSVKEIEKLIYPVGFYKTKAKRLKVLSSKINIQYKGKIPSTREELMSLPGVGRKTANLVLVRAFGEKAISVDTHVHRICNILGWVNTKTPEHTEKELMKILPKKYWMDINRYFVSIGRQYRSERQLREYLEKERLI